MRIAALVLCIGGTALAAPTNPPLVGATEVARYGVPSGFVDDVVGIDDQRIAYVIADAATKAELHVVTSGKPDEQVIDLAPVTLHPIAVTLAGPRALVIGVTDDGMQNAALLELTDKGKSKPAGTVVYRLGPATHITVVKRDGASRISIHRETATKAGTRHDVELDAIETGKRVAAGRGIEIDAGGLAKAIDFKVNDWTDGMTRAHGVKGGEWNKKEDERSPDVEATYDLVTGKFADQKKITDLFEQRKRYQVLADRKRADLDFVRIATDKNELQVWHAGVLLPVALDQPLGNYDPASLQGVVEGDGGAWIALKVDPVNPDAVARKKADVEYLDIFRASADGHAVRRARVLSTGARHRFGVLPGDRFWLIERNNGFERGGKSLVVYKLD